MMTFSMLNPFNNRSALMMLVSWFILLFSIITYFAAFTPHSHEWLTVSDAVTIQFMYDDLISGPGILKDWYFPAAPSLFPDITLYCITQFFHQNFMISILIYALLFMTMLCVLGIYIFKKIVPEAMKELAWLVPLCFAPIFLETFYFTHDITLAQLLTSAYYHAGPFLNMMLIYAVYVSDLKNWKKYIFFLLFVSFASFSDLLFVVMFSCPFTLTLFATMKKESFKQHLILVLLVGAGTLAGLKGYDILKKSGITYLYAPEKMYAFSDILPSWKTFSTHMLQWLSLPGFRQFHMIFTFLSIPIVSFLLLIKRKKLKLELYFYLLFSVLFTLAVVAAPIINGNYIGSDTLRYSAGIFYISLLNLAIALAGLLIRDKWKNRTRNSVITATLSLLFVLIVIKFSFKGLHKFADYYPSRVRQLDSLSTIYGFKRGISTQTHSKVATMFSKKGLEVLAVHNDGCVAEFGSNISWYYNNKDFDFVITNVLRPDIGDKFRVKDTIKFYDTDHQYELTLYTVEKFYYPDRTYTPVNR